MVPRAKRAADTRVHPRRCVFSPAGATARSLEWVVNMTSLVQQVVAADVVDPLNGVLRFLNGTLTDLASVMGGLELQGAEILSQ